MKGSIYLVVEKLGEADFFLGKLIKTEKTVNFIVWQDGYLVKR